MIQVKGTVTEASPFTVKVNGKPAAVSGNQFTADNVSLYPGTNVIKADATDSSGNVGSGQVTVAYNSASPQALSYVYDKNGNLIQRIAGQNIENFNYDYENRVKTYAGSGSSVIYAYDGLGRRISKSNNGTTTKYYYDGDDVILEKTGSSSIYYVHGPQVDEIISDSRGYCYHYDGLGSVSNVTDNSGVHAATYNYKAFGVICSQSGSISSQWGFTGRQYDAESGFYYYRNRYYDPRTGRFITRDPIGFRGGVNLYAYCSNNPVNFVDPWGLCKEKSWREKGQLYLTLVGAEMEKGKMTNMQGLIGTIGVGAGAYSNIGVIPKAIGYSNKDFLQGGRMAYNWANQYGSGAKFYSATQIGRFGVGLSIASTIMTGWTIGETINAYYWGYQDYKDQCDK